MENDRIAKFKFSELENGNKLSGFKKNSLILVSKTVEFRKPETIQITNWPLLC